MKTKTIKINVYTYDELNDRVKTQIRQRLLMFFKENVKEDTLFLSDGTMFNEEGLRFKGLNNFEILN